MDLKTTESFDREATLLTFVYKELELWFRIKKKNEISLNKD